MGELASFLVAALEVIQLAEMEVALQEVLAALNQLAVIAAMEPRLVPLDLEAMLQVQAVAVAAATLVGAVVERDPALVEMAVAAVHPSRPPRLMHKGFNLEMDGSS